LVKNFLPSPQKINITMTTTPGDEIYTDSEELKGPRQAKGGVFAIADIPLIKAALYTHLKTLDENDPNVTNIASLLHRLGRVG
jgi:hypothetical protein